MSSEQLGLPFPFPIFIAFSKISLLCKSKAEILLDILPRHCCRNHPPCPLPCLQSCHLCFILRAGGLHVSLHTADCLIQEELCGVHRRISTCAAHKILSIEAYAIQGQGAQSLCCAPETHTVRETNDTSIFKSACVKSTKQNKTGLLRSHRSWTLHVFLHSRPDTATAPHTWRAHTPGIDSPAPRIAAEMAGLAGNPQNALSLPPASSHP